MPRMRSCLAGIGSSAIPILSASLAANGFQLPLVANRINVTELGLAAPNVLVIDIDDLEVDPLETLRMIRFVLPACLIVVYTQTLKQDWALACHLAGANCILSKENDEARLVAGLKRTFAWGCFTDPSFTAA